MDDAGWRALKKITMGPPQEGGISERKVKSSNLQAGLESTDVHWSSVDPDWAFIINLPLKKGGEFSFVTR